MNKIVEILEKAKSYYWPALQNVYMNGTEGERWPCENVPPPPEEGVSTSWVGPLPTLGMGRGLPAPISSFLESRLLRGQVSVNTLSCPSPFLAIRDGG